MPFMGHNEHNGSSLIERHTPRRHNQVIHASMTFSECCRSQLRHFWNKPYRSSAFFIASRFHLILSLLFVHRKLFVTHFVRLDFGLEFFQGNFCHTQTFFDLLNEFISEYLIGTKPFSSHIFQHHFITL